MFYLIRKINLHSKPSNKKYIKVLNLKKLMFLNHDLGLISTSLKGVITFTESLLLRWGGEVVFYLKN